MRTKLGWRSTALAACLLGFTSAGAGNAADVPGATPLDRKALDEQIYKTLREVINKGADLYNSGDQNGCYRLYEGALLALQPLLDHRPEMQKAIATGIEDARRNADLSRRAFVLRDVIDKVRNDIHPKKPEDTGKPPPAGGKTLWDRLGGEANVTRVVDDFVESAALDDKVKFDREGKYPLPEDKLKHLKQMVVEWISVNTGGTIKKYTGKEMKTVHEGMGITDAQFNALAANLKKALEKNGARAEDVKALLDIVEKTRKDIVEKSDKPKEDKKDEAEKKPSVSGIVSYNGKPVTAGSIAFHPEKGEPASAVIQADGSYKVDAAGIGDCTVTITAGAGAVLPKKYQDPKTSPLKYTVKKGSQTLDLELKD